MAGWKLRKDKTSTETPGDDPEAAAPTERISPEEPLTHEPMTEEPIFLDTVPGPLPDFEADDDLNFTNLNFDSDKEEPLTLVDYSEPHSENPSPQSLETGARVFEMPPPAEPDEFQPAPDDFQERLRTGRYDVSELAPPPEIGFGSGIPEVAPFVLDTPPPAAPPLPASQLVVHLGRLAAAFPLTKEVTTIGRPDSALHHYPDVEIEMDDAVSRHHAEVIQRADGYHLVDTGSTNGTLLNGEKLPPHQECLLVRGDRIRMGDRTEIIFE